jgi:hypothetical protein
MKSAVFATDMLLVYLLKFFVQIEAWSVWDEECGTW